MATFTMDVPDHLVPRIVAASRKWLEIELGLPTEGVGAVPVMRRVTKELWKDIVVQYEAGEVASTVRDTVEAEFAPIQGD